MILGVILLFLFMVFIFSSAALTRMKEENKEYEVFSVFAIIVSWSIISLVCLSIWAFVIKLIIFLAGLRLWE